MRKIALAHAALAADGIADLDPKAKPARLA
jgi:hypothetical protein